MAYNWSSMAELAEVVTNARKATRGMEQQVQGDGASAAEFVADAYSFAGREDSVGSAKGSKVLRQTQRIATSLRDIENALSIVIAELKAAADAVDENEAQRRQQRSRLQA